MVLFVQKLKSLSRKLSNLIYQKKPLHFRARLMEIRASESRWGAFLLRATFCTLTWHFCVLWRTCSIIPSIEDLRTPPRRFMDFGFGTSVSTTSTSTKFLHGPLIRVAGSFLFTWYWRRCIFTEGDPGERRSSIFSIRGNDFRPMSASDTLSRNLGLAVTHRSVKCSHIHTALFDQGRHHFDDYYV